MTREELIKELRLYAGIYRESPFHREVEGTQELLEKVANYLQGAKTVKDKECKEYIHTYKCNKKTCDGCKNRYVSEIITELEDCAKQEDCPVYLGDREIDSYVKLSEVIEIINKYVD
ncbi:hypothetical protein [Velocimicrobium porci]|uniref:Uncharacterized protein n=1 Tax=Velocimicrobium porci TaxID=2606634 RepID=A0A6L5Y0S4_9FIRM|nr:hypothetical protein [Velocimicrobium porci]MSS64582.1 hypothetical protein [Velocimicrobium porci]